MVRNNSKLCKESDALPEEILMWLSYKKKKKKLSFEIKF